MSLPTFPPEIWRAILRLSVDIPGSLDTKWNHSPDTLLWHEWEPSYCYTQQRDCRREYYSALKTKLSIVQVSKTWQEIGVELLYEHLSFLDKNQHVQDVDVVFQPMSMVAAVFERHANEAGGYGRATKRIDVSASILHHSALPILIRLLTACDNLRILVISKCELDRGAGCDAAGLSHLASLLQTRFSHSLRRISFNLDAMDMAPDSGPLEYHLHLPSLPLDALEFGTESYSSHEPHAITTVSVMTIHTAYILLQNMASWHCPALRHLTLIYVTDECIQSHLSFLISHGPQLISLALFSLDFGRNFNRLAQLLAPATNLRCLVIDVIDAHYVSEKDIFPSITHIGIHVNPGNIYTSFPATGFFTPSTFPNLRCLRFLEISDERPRWLLDIASEFNHARVENKDCKQILV